jgi:hypothetical protein
MVETALGRLITQRSAVRIRPPLLPQKPLTSWFRGLLVAVGAHNRGEFDPVVTELVTAASPGAFGSDTVPRMAVAASRALCIHARDDVHVDLLGEGDGGVSESFADHFDWCAARQWRSCV